MPELTYQRHTQSVLLRADCLARRGVRSTPAPPFDFSLPHRLLWGSFYVHCQAHAQEALR